MAFASQGFMMDIVKVSNEGADVVLLQRVVVLAAAAAAVIVAVIVLCARSRWMTQTQGEVRWDEVKKEERRSEYNKPDGDDVEGQDVGDPVCHVCNTNQSERSLDAGWSSSGLMILREMG
jgi:hypothetical protein